MVQESTQETQEQGVLDQLRQLVEHGDGTLTVLIKDHWIETIRWEWDTLSPLTGTPR